MTTIVLNSAWRSVRRLDGAVAATLLMMAIVALAAPAQLPESLRFLFDAMASILPFIAISVLAAAAAKATGLDRQIAAVFSGNPTRTIVLAALFGVASPFCSCGVIPIIAGLLSAGVPLAPVMAFWIASPLMSPEKFLVMLGAFEPGFTVAAVLGALLMGLFAGFATHVLAAAGRLPSPLRQDGQMSACRVRGLTENKPLRLAFWHEAERRRIFRDASAETGLFLLKWLTLAFFVESLMIAYVPADQIGHWLGNDAWWAIPGSILVGIPAYLNGYAAIPLIAGLQGLGMSPGAALGFMLAGGVTSIPAAMAVFALVRRTVFVWYLGFGVGGALAMAYAAQLILAG